MLDKRIYDKGVSYSPRLKRKKESEDIPLFMRDCRPFFDPDSRSFVLEPVNPSRPFLAKKMVPKCYTSDVSQGKDGSSNVINLHNVKKRSFVEVGREEASVRGKATLTKRIIRAPRSKKFAPPIFSIGAPRSKKFTPPKLPIVAHDRGKATLTKRIIRAPRSKKFAPPKLPIVAHDSTSDSRDSFSSDLSPRYGEREISLSPSICEVVVNEKSGLVQSPLVETMKSFDRSKVEKEVTSQVDYGMFVANNACKKVEICNKDLGPRMGTSYGNCSKLSVDGHQDTDKLLESNSPKKKSLSLAMDAVLRESDNFLLVKESNNQSSLPFRVNLERMKICKALNLFDDIYGKLFKIGQSKPKFERGSYVGQIPIEAAVTAKLQLKWFSTNERVVGAVPGIKVGDLFRFRAQLVLIGLHCQYVVGIDYMKKDGKNVAISIVDSGRYGNGKASDHCTLEVESPDIFYYSGQGGNPQISSSNFPKEVEDQKLEGGNLALVNSMEENIPIRVIRKVKTFQVSNPRAKSGIIHAFSYVGLYVVSNCTQERGPYGKLIFKFQFNRIQGQPDPAKCLANTTDKSKSQHDCYVVDPDVSRGKEKMPIRALNAIDKEKPPSFNYVTEMMYAKKHDDVASCYGCDCIDGCSDESPCSCLIKNGGEIPFNGYGAILEPKSIVYECGPSCKCPPSCKNRVSQNGIRYELEIFKTESKGWGVRSRSFIASGSFVCEYAGEMLTEKEAEKRTNNDEYLFDIGIDNDNYVARSESFCHTRSQSKRTDDEDGFTIDAAEHGNIGRFINHSCSPNLFAQDVVYDHNDKRRPHIMLFASKSIPPLREFSFDYNYKIGQVHDANGNIKIKNCYCGAHDCIGRMY